MNKAEPVSDSIPLLKRYDTPPAKNERARQDGILYKAVTKTADKAFISYGA